MVHPRFASVADDVLTLLPAGGSASRRTLKEACTSKTIASESVAYYMAITQRILVEAGVDPDKLRFRQHEPDEMAHYAADCWDAEVELSFGWTECVGIADRTDYDLEAHMKASGADLRAYVRFDEPKTVEKTVVSPVHNVLGPRYKKEAKDIARALESMDACTLEGREFAEVDVAGKKVRVDKDCYAIKKVTETVNGRWFTPHVIEPSYGIDRIIYAILEHSYSEGTKENEPYTVLKLRPGMAPIQAGVFPLTGKDELVVVAEDIERRLRGAGIATYLDASDSIGRRYARMDEVGTPLCITVDFDSLKDGTVTIRDRDSTGQIRVKSEGIAGMVGELVAGQQILFT
jgi:glycyl-tRNA synthetase